VSTNVNTRQHQPRSWRPGTWTRGAWPHLREHQLAGAALQLLNGEAPALKASAESHLLRCERCAARLEELREVLAGERGAAADAVDALFAEERLKEQRQSILDRLERRQKSARVLHFPAITEPVNRRDRPAMRWVAAAAAAGLFVGLAASPVVFPDVQRFPRSSAANRSWSSGAKWWVPSSVTAKPGTSRITPETDELFLSEMESALNKRRIAPLKALDDLTPRTHDLVNGRRRR
jgi:hypothetical protein